MADKKYLDEIRARFSYVDPYSQGSLLTNLENMKKKIEPPPDHPGPHASKKELLHYQIECDEYKKKNLAEFIESYKKASTKPKSKKVIKLLNKIIGEEFDENDLLNDI